LAKDRHRANLLLSIAGSSNSKSCLVGTFYGTVGASNLNICLIGTDLLPQHTYGAPPVLNAVQV